ncbi:hypothetical protein [Malacoplasma penetrans HF-2]|uniref:Uncharacterized protein n=1 Tax=Malacoplasma penetrans (strain HF-2) TaxID=272633 RepID=Q8EVM6_MALP2|nr:hypothetical protein [Malacoplasma penetrans]BAC44326.1 hypothetical protein [Malacoplasma penetrans HF-2]
MKTISPSGSFISLIKLLFSLASGFGFTFSPLLPLSSVSGTCGLLLFSPFWLLFPSWSFGWLLPFGSVGTSALEEFNWDWEIGIAIALAKAVEPTTTPPPY